MKGMENKSEQEKQFREDVIQTNLQLAHAECERHHFAY